MGANLMINITKKPIVPYPQGGTNFPPFWKRISRPHFESRVPTVIRITLNECAENKTPNGNGMTARHVRVQDFGSNQI